MQFTEITVASGQDASDWLDLPELVGERIGVDAKQVAALVGFAFPDDYDQASVTLEFAEESDGTTLGRPGGALFDTDTSGTALSELAFDAAKLDRVLDPATFCYAKYVRVVLPANASQAFTFGLRYRRAS